MANGGCSFVGMRLKPGILLFRAVFKARDGNVAVKIVVAPMEREI